MRYLLLIPCCLTLVAMMGVPVMPAWADPGAPDRPQEPEHDEDAKAQDPVAVAIAKVNEEDNGITIDRKQSFVDVQAKVCLRTGEFLEMFACTTDTREHESILVLDAKPSTIHLGLLLLGQEPGKPLSYDLNFDPPKMVKATGPEVNIFVVRDVAGKEREIPANRWVMDSKTKKMMGENTWLFAGSQFKTFEGKQIYRADVNGSAISLVNFGDDLLTLPNKLTHENNSHDMVWVPRTDAIPAVGTKVILRLRVQAPKDAEAGEDQDQAGEPKEGEPAPEPSVSDAE